MKRILVPVDFSPAMNGVLLLASEMARGCEMELHLVHVREIAAAPVFPATTIGYPGIGMPEMGMAGGLPTAVAGCLPPDHLRIELDFSYEEVAAITERGSRDAARMAVQRALRKLADVMGHER